MPFPFYSPDELAALQDEHNRAEIAQEEFRHSIQRMFEELPEDQLSILEKMLRVITNAEKDEFDHMTSISVLWAGQIGWELKKRFNVCASCGVNHDKEIQQSNPQAEVETEPEWKSEDDEDEEVDHIVDGRERRADGTIVWSLEEQNRMNEYHLDDLYKWNEDETYAEFVGFACTGIDGTNGPCGLTYISIDDRMLKAPEECSGCFQRMMHG